jgi:REP-associated tyrosine transposase
MEGHRKSSHAVYRCEYHFVWVPKYRYQVLVQEVKSRLKDILNELCEWLDITIIEGAICSDHVHMYVSVPPKHSPAKVMKLLKGKIAEYLRKEFPEMRKQVTFPKMQPVTETDYTYPCFSPAHLTIDSSRSFR